MCKNIVSLLEIINKKKKKKKGCQRKREMAGIQKNIYTDS